MSNDVNLFWELLELSDAKLIVDNDMCIVEYNTWKDDSDYESFDFGPKNLAFIFGSKLEIDMENC